MSIDSSGDQDAGERRTGPTVTRDKWVNHARHKLAKGYVLIVSGTRKNANFYSPQKGYEMCAYDVAKKLIAEGLVAKTRKHHLGDVYELTAPLPVVPKEERRIADDDDDEPGTEAYAGIDPDVEAEEDEEEDVDAEEADDLNDDSDYDDEEEEEEEDLEFDDEDDEDDA